MDLTLDRPLRFSHIDGCHSYPCVASDIALGAAHTAPREVLALDDYRTEYLPGVAAAIWQAWAQGTIHPFAVTDDELYAATSPPISATGPTWSGRSAPTCTSCPTSTSSRCGHDRRLGAAPMQHVSPLPRGYRPPPTDRSATRGWWFPTARQRFST